MTNNEVNSSGYNSGNPAERRFHHHRHYFIGTIIIIIGLGLLLSNLIPWFNFWSIFWSVFLIVIGLFIIIGRRR